MPPPLHSPWSRWVSWIFKDIPTLLSIWAPSVQLLMFKQTDTQAWRLQRLYTALWTKVWPALFTKGNRGAGQLKKCAPAHYWKDRTHLSTNTLHVLRSKPCGAFKENLTENAFFLWKWNENFSENESYILFIQAAYRKQAHTRHFSFKKSH